MTDPQEYPVSVVPAALDRGHLYSPTLDLTRYALDETYTYDYRPGDLFEPMPPAPHGGEDHARWRRETAWIASPDFLGLRAGDEIVVNWAGYTTFPAVVVATYRRGAIVRYPLPEGAQEPYAEMQVCRRNDAGHWYP